MPANVYNLFSPTVGDTVVQSNSYRVMLVYKSAQFPPDLAFIGSSLETGIPMLSTLNETFTLLVNEVGTAMQGPITILQNNSFGFTTITEIARTPSGVT